MPWEERFIASFDISLPQSCHKVQIWLRVVVPTCTDGQVIVMMRQIFFCFRSFAEETKDSMIKCNISQCHWENCALTGDELSQNKRNVTIFRVASIFRMDWEGKRIGRRIIEGRVQWLIETRFSFIDHIFARNVSEVVRKFRTKKSESWILSK